MAGLYRGFDVPAEIEAEVDKLLRECPIEPDGVDVPAEITAQVADVEPSGSHGPGATDCAGTARTGHGTTAPQAREQLPGIGSGFAGGLAGGVTSDPARDLNRLENRLRHHVTHLDHTTRQLQDTVNTLRAELTMLTGSGTRYKAGPGLSTRRERRRTATQLRDAIDELTAAVDMHDQASGHLRAVREFIRALDLPDGPLAHTHVSWQPDRDDHDDGAHAGRRAGRQDRG